MTVDLCAVLGCDPTDSGRCRDCDAPIGARPGPDRVGNPRPLPGPVNTPARRAAADALAATLTPVPIDPALSPARHPRPSLPARVLRRWVS